MPKPRENESKDDFIERCIPIVLEDDTAEDNEQAVAVCNSLWEDAQEKGKAQPHVVKALSETPEHFLVGGYGHVWGDVAHTDLVAEYFTPESDLMPGLVPVKLVLYHHGYTFSPGGDYFDHPIGKAAEEQTFVDDTGKWINAQLSKRAEYVDEVMELIDRGVLAWSSGSVPHLAKCRPDGWLQQWPVVEYSLTPTPAEPRMTDVNRMKAAYKAAVLDWPVEIDPKPAEGQEREGDDGEGLRLAIVKAKFELLKLKMR